MNNEMNSFEGATLGAKFITTCVPIELMRGFVKKVEGLLGERKNSQFRNRRVRTLENFLFRIIHFVRNIYWLVYKNYGSDEKTKKC